MTEHILSLSYGKDSLACLGAIEQLGWPLDRIVHAEVWATDTIPADLPPMVEFKAHADRIIKERWGIEVERIRSKNTYENVFYRIRLETTKTAPGKIRGWPRTLGAWCNSSVKMPPLRAIETGGDPHGNRRQICGTSRGGTRVAETRGRQWWSPSDGQVSGLGTGSLGVHVRKQKPQPIPSEKSSSCRVRLARYWESPQSPELALPHPHVGPQAGWSALLP